MHLKYDTTSINLHPVEFICIVIWRCLEITSRVVTLVLFILAMKVKSLPFIAISFLISLFTPWVEFWIKGSHLPGNTKRKISQIGTVLMLIVITLINSVINIFCWSGVELQLSNEEFINKTHRGNYKTIHYSVRLLENVIMILIFKFTSDKYLFSCCDSLIVTQLIIVYLLSIGFMLLFYQPVHTGWSGNSFPEETERPPEPI